MQLTLAITSRPYSGVWDFVRKRFRDSKVEIKSFKNMLGVLLASL